MEQGEVYAYQAVADDLLRRINEGEWQPGQRLPTLKALEQKYPQSRMTVYKGLERLEELGYISMKQGRGIFVRRARPLPRVAILTNMGLSHYSYMPFAYTAFQYAHAYFVRVGMDAQLYSEDGLNETGLPNGLLLEMERKKIAGMLAIEARLPSRHARTEEWNRQTVPVVNLGAAPFPYTVYVDRNAFLDRAVALATARGRSRLALIERAEHLEPHRDLFRESCAKHGAMLLESPQRMPSPELSYEEYGFELMQRVWEADVKPDAVIVPDDVIAKGVAQATLALRLSVPEEVLVIAMTNRGVQFFYPVPVIRFEVDVEALVARASRMLTDMMAGVETPPQTALVPPLAPEACDHVPENSGSQERAFFVSGRVP